ncbi:hypothetical protein Trydic_g20589 [Trypoxylus dichotomus]
MKLGKTEYASTTATDRKKRCEHVIKVEKGCYENEMLIDEYIEPLAINLCDNSSDNDRRMTTANRNENEDSELYSTVCIGLQGEYIDK